MDTPFVSDGCSVVGPIVRAFGYRNERIKKCCLEHDLDYWVGGPLSEKRVADRWFRNCLVLKADMPQALALVMWLGVTVGGFFPHPNFRWGFGWKWPRYK